MTAAVAAVPARALSVEAVEVAHRYAPGRGLEPLSFEVTSPGVIAVTGPNGSGKSTLLRILAGLLKPSAGTTRILRDGEEVARTRWRDLVGLAAPELSFYDELTVVENLNFAGEALGMADIPGSTRHALERVGLEGRSDDRVAALSSGMKQRLRLAFAILRSAPVLLLDEPGSHLDDAGRAVVGRVIDDHRRAGIVFLATNDDREVGLAERRIELRGRGLGHSA